MIAVRGVPVEGGTGMSDTASIPTTAEERAEWREIMRELNDGDNAFMRLLADVERLDAENAELRNKSNSSAM